MIPRPKTWAEYIGQREAVERLAVMCTAAKERGGVLDHILISGPPGLGKTSLAQIIASSMGAPFVSQNGASITGGAQLAELLVALEPGSIFFIDEIHRLNMRIVELLYTALEDFRVDLVEDFDGEARSVNIDLVRFCMIGATTRAGMLPAPLRRRFRARVALEYYGVDDLCRIIEQAEESVGVELSPGARQKLASRSDGTPNTALTLLSRLADYHQVDGSGETLMTDDKAVAALKHLGVMAGGLEKPHIRFLEILEKQKTRRAGIQHIASVLGEDTSVLEEMLEPLLMRQELIGRLSNGRYITEAGLAYLKAYREGKV